MSDLLGEGRNKAESGAHRRERLGVCTAQAGGSCFLFSCWQQLALHLGACGCDNYQNVYCVTINNAEAPPASYSEKEREATMDPGAREGSRSPAHSPLTLCGRPRCKDTGCAHPRAWGSPSPPTQPAPSDQHRALPQPGHLPCPSDKGFLEPPT